MKAAPSETEEIQFLCTVCAIVKSDPYLVNFFIEVRKQYFVSVYVIKIFKKNHIKKYIFL